MLKRGSPDIWALNRVMGGASGLRGLTVGSTKWACSGDYAVAWFSCVIGRKGGGPVRRGARIGTFAEGGGSGVYRKAYSLRGDPSGPFDRLSSSSVRQLKRSEQSRRARCTVVSSSHTRRHSATCIPDHKPALRLYHLSGVQFTEEARRLSPCGWTTTNFGRRRRFICVHVCV